MSQIKRYELDQASLKEILHYEPETGVFTWIKVRGGTAAGSLAGSKNSNGYVNISIKGSLHRAHRLAFLYMTGSLPVEDVDHINRARSDNRWSNLRAATTAENVCNSGIRADNLSGVKGVSWHVMSRAWRVQVRGRIGNYDAIHHCFLEAVAAAYRMQNMLHREFANNASAKSAGL